MIVVVVDRPIDMNVFLAAAGDKHEAAELIVLMLVPMALSFVLWRVVESRILKGGSLTLRWASLIPLVFGVYLSSTPFMDIRDSQYRSFHSVSDRSESLHYASFFVPLAATLLLGGWVAWKVRQHKLEG